MTISVHERQKALQEYVKSFNVLVSDEFTYTSPIEFLNDCTDSLFNIIQNHVKTQSAVKVQLRLTVTFESATDPEKDAVAHFTNRQVLFLLSSNISELLQGIYTDIERKIEEFQALSSGWRVREVIDGSVHFAKYIPLSGACTIELPDRVKHSKAVINIKNSDNACFFLVYPCCVVS